MFLIVILELKMASFICKEIPIFEIYCHILIAIRIGHIYFVNDYKTLQDDLYTIYVFHYFDNFNDFDESVCNFARA